MTNLLAIIIFLFLSSLITVPIIVIIIVLVTKSNVETVKGEREEKKEENPKPLSKMEILEKRVDMRIWELLIRKFEGKVVNYVPMQPYTEGGDMDITVVFNDGTSGIYRVFLPLARMRGAEMKNKADDYRIKPVPKEEKADEVTMDKVVEFVAKNIVNGKEFLVPKEIYNGLDVSDVIETLMFEELIDTTVSTEDNKLIVMQNKVAVG